jgi:SAM-dependent methyltransferase
VERLAATLDTWADGYERHVGRYSPELAAALIAVAGVERGQRALDVGCGTGALAQALAALLGADSVAAVDPSQACARRVPAADVRVARAEELPFGDNDSDVALAQLVVPWMSDSPRGVAEMRRVVRPGGVVAASTWDFASGMTMLRTLWDAALAIDPRRAAEAGAGSRSLLCAPTSCASCGEASVCSRSTPETSWSAPTMPSSTTSGGRLPPASAARAATAPRSTRRDGKRCGRRSADAPAGRRDRSA